MRWTKSSGAMRCVLLTALLSGIGVQAADNKKPSAAQPVSAVADTQASARHQGAVNVSGINWACKGTHCSALAMPAAVAAPLAACQELAREVGAIKSFKVANHAMNAKELQQCNSAVPAVAAVIQNAKTPQSAGFAKPSPDVVRTTPVNISTGTLSMTGNRFESMTITTSPLSMTGNRFEAVAITTSPLSMTGNRFDPMTITTSTLSMTGKR